MKKNVPFSKTIGFKTIISEITSIEIKHTLSLKDNNEVEGDIIVSGKYKITDASIVEEDFNYNLPFVIAIDNKYDVDNIEISISDFNYEIIDENSLKIDVDIELDNILEKEERKDTVFIDEVDSEYEQESAEKEEVIPENIVNDETFSTYYVYIVRETDTIDDILNKYNINKETLAMYNDIDDISIGTKLIIPCSND